MVDVGRMVGGGGDGGDGSRLGGFFMAAAGASFDLEGRQRGFSS